ncbi:TPA: MurR/RpiR family transcriptional regulator [Staphylococcus aureus]|nr:MurR/RpiR family transcriptional regulator [Staphylococcus aureus]HCX9336806.1 MurR/RpiR family transcriptional regulator [Staphylococcus aureus]HDH6865985.1 MurR/RpiR family transcriptional regulator [Staphylococcus aureus]HDI7449744.1 MurR/RpiR family transcriptional regulator [Staphylococcus aureus]
MTNILYRIDKQLSDFTKTEKIIADYILKNPHKIIDMTVNDLADVTNVSTASIVRFSRKMTHQGFQELKIAISRYLPEDIATNPHLELIENESVETLKNKMIARATNTMRFVALNYHAILDCITQSKMALDNYRKHLATIDFKH